MNVSSTSVSITIQKLSKLSAPSEFGLRFVYLMRKYFCVFVAYLSPILLISLTVHDVVNGMFIFMMFNLSFSELI